MSAHVKMTKEELYAEAEQRGVEVILPLKDELLLDIDEGMEFNEKAFYALDSFVNMLDRLETKSQNGGKHIYFKFDTDFDDWKTQVVLQACLGSDPLRELFTIFRDPIDHPSALFETPNEAQRVREWRKKWPATS